MNCKRRLEGKVALITGSARGIGAAMVKLFAKEGATIIISDVLDRQGQDVADEIGEMALYHHLDVCYANEWQTIFAFINDKFQHLDILVNNAGITGLNAANALLDPEHISWEDWQKVHNVNLNGVMFGCKYAIPLMKETGGSIINISSRAGLVGIPQNCAYASSKAAVRNYTKSVALYCAESGYAIRCNSIHPAAILTPLWDEMLGVGKERELAIAQIEKDIPLKKMGQPIDVAYLALYLASDEAQYVTGSEFHIDGGILAGSGATAKKS